MFLHFLKTGRIFKHFNQKFQNGQVALPHPLFAIQKPNQPSQTSQAKNSLIYQLEKLVRDVYLKDITVGEICLTKF